MCFSGQTSAVCGNGRGHICVCFSGQTSAVQGGRRGHMCEFQWRDKRCLWGQEGPYV